MLTSCRGVITAPTGRSPSRITPAIISFSPGSSTPAFSASTTSVRISSSLTLSSASPRWPSSHSSTLPERSSSHTSGSEIFASSTIAGATFTATASGSRSAICLGTSSPTISEA